MKVIQIGMGWFPEAAGGLDRFFWELLPCLPGAEIEAQGLVAGSARVEVESGGQVRSFAPSEAALLKRLRAARATVARVASDFGPDLVASHFALYTLPVLDRLAGCPLVVHFHGPWADESKGQARLACWTKALVERAVYHRGRRLIVLSRAFGRVLRERYGIADDIIRVVPGGVEVARFELACSRAEARERLGWPRDRPIVLTVRRLVRRMGLGDLVQAMTQLRRRVPDALLIVAGRGPLEEELRRRVAECGIGAHVHLVGFVAEEDLPWAYRAADLSVVPSVALEGFGLVTVESLAAGTPVLVTPVGGLPEAVCGLSSDLVLPRAGPPALAAGLAAALTGALPLPDEIACRTYARENFNWPVIVQQVRAVYEEALA